MVMLSADTGTDEGGCLIVFIGFIVVCVVVRFVVEAISWVNDHSPLVLIALPLLIIAGILLWGWLNRPSIYNKR